MKHLFVYFNRNKSFLVIPLKEYCYPEKGYFFMINIYKIIFYVVLVIIFIVKKFYSSSNYWY